jgi:hypothetical protein
MVKLTARSGNVRVELCLLAEDASAWLDCVDLPRRNLAHSAPHAKRECNFSRIRRIANATFREFAASCSLDNMASISRDCGDFLLCTDGGRRPFH